MMPKICCLPNCNSTIQTARLFRFPQQPQVALEWKKEIAWDKTKKFYITKNRYVCELHFKEKDFWPIKVGKTKRKLKSCAVPFVSEAFKLKKTTYQTPLDKNESTVNSRDADEKGRLKPPYAHWQLLVQAIASTPDKQSTMMDIRMYIMKNYPYYILNPHLWKNSVRHALSHNKYFVKVMIVEDEKHKILWKIDPAFESELIRNAFKPSYFQKKGRKKRPFLSTFKKNFSNSQSAIPEVSSRSGSSASEHVEYFVKSDNVVDTAAAVDTASAVDGTAAATTTAATTTALDTLIAPPLPPHHPQGRVKTYTNNRPGLKGKYLKYGRRGGKDKSRPMFTYKQLIVQAISSSREKQLRLEDIFSYVLKSNPYYQTHKTWQHSIKANLAYRRHFYKLTTGDECFWRIIPAYESMLVASAYIPWKMEQRKFLNKSGSKCTFKSPMPTVPVASQHWSPKLEYANLAASSPAEHPSATVVDSKYANLAAPSPGKHPSAGNADGAPLPLPCPKRHKPGASLAETSKPTIQNPSLLISALLSKSCSVQVKKLDDGEMLKGVNWHHKRGTGMPPNFHNYEAADVHADSENNACDDFIVVKEELLEAQDKAGKDDSDFTLCRSVTDLNHLLCNNIQGNTQLESNPIDATAPSCNIPNGNAFGNVTEENDCIEIDNSDNDWIRQEKEGGIVYPIDEGCVNNDSDRSTLGRDGARLLFIGENQDLCNSFIHYESFASRRFPSDKAHFSEPLNTQEKQFIILKGPCQPPGPFPCAPAQGYRSFSVSHYTMVNKAGMKLKRAWLCYSAASDYVYCQPCWLFSTTNREDAWVKGMCNWGVIAAEIEKHENSSSHLHCCIIQEQWRMHKMMTVGVEESMRNEALFWRQVLERTISTTLTLFSSNLSFIREHDGMRDNHGNSLAIISLLSKYDPVLEKLLSMPDTTVNYLTQTIQNELIGILSKSVRDNIIKDVNSAPFFSVIMTTTQDQGKMDHLSQVVRYVSVSTDQSGKPVKIQINESFSGFVQINTQSEDGLNISKLRGQGYDGSACMSDVYSGLQAELHTLQPKAAYVHCASHDLNLILKDAMSDVMEVRNFFKIVKNIYNFFAHSLSRWNKLCLFLPDSSVNLNKVCPKKWSSWYDTLLALRYRLADILKLLSNIILLSRKEDDVSEATELKSKIEQFQFIFLIVLLTKILDSIGCISLLLRSSQCDLSKAAELFQTSCAALQETRNQYDSIRKTSVEIAKTWGISDCFEECQVLRVKKFSDELCDEKRSISAEKRFKVNVFYATLDIACVETRQRSESLMCVVSAFKALQPSVLMSATDSELCAAGKILAKQYDTDLSPFLPFQLLSFRSCIKHELPKISTIQEIASLLIVEKYFLSSSFPDIYTACMLFLTLPVTVAPCELSLSKQDRIKNYLRNTVFDEQLNDLAMLSIENDRAKKLNVSKIVDIYTDASARKTPRQ